MTAVFYEAPGRFALGMSAPIEPGPGEVRLEVAYCGVCGTDLHIAQGHMDHRVRAPQVIGHEMSGVVAESAKGSTPSPCRRSGRRTPSRHPRRDAGRQGRHPHLSRPEVSRNRHARGVSAVVDGACVHAAPTTCLGRSASRRPRRAARCRVPRRATRAALAPGDPRSSSAAGRSVCSSPSSPASVARTSS